MSHFLIAQISDMHVLPEGRLCYGHSETNGKLRACIDAILALPVQPDVVLATGDLVQAGGREQLPVPARTSRAATHALLRRGRQSR